jgi:CheY-like chemotaxis protein
MWFSDTDLERFRMETVLVAQRYLLKHPEMIEMYNKPVLDPVTGTMRKKALFSMPALRAGDTSSLSSSSDKNSEREDSSLLARRENMKTLAYRNVKSILVADRNRIILDLFRRSLRNVFPHARITTAQSGEEALRYFEEAWSSARRPGPFDIVIAEDRLDQPLTSTGTPVLSTGKSLSLGLGVAGVNETAEQDSGAVARAGPRHVRHDSLLSLSSQRRSMTNGTTGDCSGADLLRKIASSHSNPSPAPSEALTLDEAASHRRRAACLLIGVSVQPDKEKAAFHSAGADAVWGKPPPRMDDRLRDELVALLVRKRERPELDS